MKCFDGPDQHAKKKSKKALHQPGIIRNAGLKENGVRVAQSYHCELFVCFVSSQGLKCVFCLVRHVQTVVLAHCAFQNVMYPHVLPSNSRVSKNHVVVELCVEIKLVWGDQAITPPAINESVQQDETAQNFRTPQNKKSKRNFCSINLITHEFEG